MILQKKKQYIQNCKPGCSHFFCEFACKNIILLLFVSPDLYANFFKKIVRHKKQMKTIKLQTLIRSIAQQQQEKRRILFVMFACIQFFMVFLRQDSFCNPFLFYFVVVIDARILGPGDPKRELQRNTHVE